MVDVCLVVHDKELQGHVEMSNHAPFDNVSAVCKQFGRGTSARSPSIPTCLGLFGASGIALQRALDEDYRAYHRLMQIVSAPLLTPPRPARGCSVHRGSEPLVAPESETDLTTLLQNLLVQLSGLSRAAAYHCSPSAKPNHATHSYARTAD